MNATCHFCGASAMGCEDRFSVAWWAAVVPGKSLVQVADAGFVCHREECCFNAEHSRLKVTHPIWDRFPDGTVTSLKDVPLDHWTWDEFDRVTFGYTWDSACSKRLLDMTVAYLGPRPTKPGVNSVVTDTDRRIATIVDAGHRAPCGEADAVVVVYERMKTARIMAVEMFGVEGADPHIVVSIAEAISAEVSRATMPPCPPAANPVAPKL